VKPVVLLIQPLDGPAEVRLRQGAEVMTPRSLDEGDIAEAAARCDAIVARTARPITRRILEAGRRLRVVGVAAVGVDHVDRVAAAELGIAVLNRAEAASDAVAEFTVALMLELLRPTKRLQAEYARGRFAEARAAAHGRELRDLTVGIVGLGRIGGRVGRICSAGFGARVLYNDIVEVPTPAFEAIPTDKDRVWAESDIVTLHVPLTADTRGMIGAGSLDHCKPGAMLINTARGKVVDTAALTAALQSGRLSGAGLDVIDPEPLPPEHPLWTCESVILTPHAASRTHGGLRRMFDIVEDVLSFLGQ
jgi:phosphoglycerate dehydrogenase-like enzyme